MPLETNLILPDLHFPNHDETALKCAIAAAKELQPKRIIILGDWLDAHQFSSHGGKSLAEARITSFQDDLDGVCKILDELDKHTSQIVYIEGNHENRVERWALKDRGNTAAFEAISPAKVIGGRPRTVWVPYVDPPFTPYKLLPDLWCVHGWSHAKAAAATHLRLATSFSIIHGHTHRVQSDTKKDHQSGRVLKAWSPGCLCKIQPLWTGANPTDWSHGLGVVFVDRRNGQHWDFTVKIENGKAVLPSPEIVRA